MAYSSVASLHAHDALPTDSHPLPTDFQQTKNTLQKQLKIAVVASTQSCSETTLSEETLLSHETNNQRNNSSTKIAINETATKQNNWFYSFAVDIMHNLQQFIISDETFSSSLHQKLQRFSNTSSTTNNGTGPIQATGRTFGACEFSSDQWLSHIAFLET